MCALRGNKTQGVCMKGHKCKTKLFKIPSLWFYSTYSPLTRLFFFISALRKCSRCLDIYTDENECRLLRGHNRGAMFSHLSSFILHYANMSMLNRLLAEANVLPQCLYTVKKKNIPSWEESGNDAPALLRWPHSNQIVPEENGANPLIMLPCLLRKCSSTLLLALWMLSDCSRSSLSGIYWLFEQ